MYIYCIITYVYVCFICTMQYFYLLWFYLDLQNSLSDTNLSKPVAAPRKYIPRRQEVFYLFDYYVYLLHYILRWNVRYSLLKILEHIAVYVDVRLVLCNCDSFAFSVFLLTLTVDLRSWICFRNIVNNSNPVIFK